jgi:hypothetical protein
MNYSRDRSLNYIKARKNHSCYGMGIGIMILDEVYPGFPGDVRNASAYPFPVQYEIIENVDINKLVFEEDKTPCLEPIQRAAKKLEKMGCRSIAAECGYFAYFQREIAGYVDVPVFMSSLLQVPWAQQLIGPEKNVGVLIAAGGQLTQTHLDSVGIKPDSKYIISKGVVDSGKTKELENLWIEGKRPQIPQAHYDKAEKEFIEVAVDFYHSHSNMGAMVLECTGFQVFARALQREIDIPVFSWGTLLDYAFSVTVHRDYYGHV